MYFDDFPPVFQPPVWPVAKWLHELTDDSYATAGVVVRVPTDDDATTRLLLLPRQRQSTDGYRNRHELE